MKKEEFSKALLENAKEIEIELNEEQIDKFYKYMNLLLEWNQKMNLTAITDPEGIILKHFIDSLTIASKIKKDATLVDMGTGAGFPGIPVKIYRNDIKITLVDSLNKRLNFLNEVIKELNLEKIETIHSRAEEFGKNKNYRESFDVATSRAVANLSTLSEYLLPLVKEKGICICMKGGEVEEELNNAKKAIRILGGKVKKIDKFELPKSSIKRSIVLLEKLEKTPAKYPRKPGTPAKEPIS